MKIDHKANPDSKLPTMEEQMAAFWEGSAAQEAMRQRIMKIKQKQGQNK